jgi:DNA processing protein
MDLALAIRAARQSERPPRNGPDAGFAPGVWAIGPDEADWPEPLRRLHTPPAALFLRGAAWPKDQLKVALVGSRRCTEDGRWVAHDLARSLSQAGVIVASGLALGIDAAAHEGALLGPTPTAAVVASDVDHPTPLQHRPLARQILHRGGWLVSERAPHAVVRPHDFPRRNRILAALVDLLVVVEAGLHSGTLSTVEHALAVGTEVAAVPGPVTSAAAEGTNVLLQAGAHVDTNAADILTILGRLPPKPVPLDDDADGDALLRGVPGGSASREAWMERSGLSPVRARAAVLRLIARGALRVLPGGRLSRVLG